MTAQWVFLVASVSLTAKSTHPLEKSAMVMVHVPQNLESACVNVGTTQLNRARLASLVSMVRTATGVLVSRQIRRPRVQAMELVTEAERQEVQANALARRVGAQMTAPSVQRVWARQENAIHLHVMLVATTGRAPHQIHALVKRAMRAKLAKSLSATTGVETMENV